MVSASHSRQSVRLLLTTAGLAGALAFPAIASAQGATAATRPITVQLQPLNNSGVAGTATLTPMGTKTRVEIRVSPGGNPAMPSHIHEGTCATLNPTPKYPLNPVANGVATTEVDVPLASLLTGQFAVNLHKSAQEASTYTSCGTIVAGASALPATGSGPMRSALPLLGGLGAVVAGGGAFWLRRKR